MSDKTTETNKKWNRLPLIAMAALPLSVGLVFAQTSGNNATAQTPQRVQPVQPGQRNQQNNQTQPGQNQQGQPQQQSGTNYADVFLQKLASALGISLDKLKAAAVTAGNATIDQGVKAGDFSSDMATNMKQRLQTDPFAMAGGRGGRGGHGGMRGMDGRGGFGGGQAVNAAVAQALGLTEAALAQELQSGKTIAELAQAKGISTAKLHDAAVAALKTQLDADVQAGRLTQTQADDMLSRAQQDTNFGLNAGRGFGGGFDGRGGHHDFDQQQGQDGTTGSNTDFSDAVALGDGI